MSRVTPEETDTQRRRRARRIVETLARLYPEAECELEHRDPFQLLVATILSAQTTDRAVNRVTPALFARWPDAAALAAADPAEVEPLIASIGLYRNKARAIVGAARCLVDRHGGRVPRDREALEELPGVGRKTASVVLSSAFGEPALAVDTHVQRLARRLGLSQGRDPRRIEDDLTAMLPPERWGFASHALIWHGRRVCDARAPRCGECALAALCPSAGSAAPRTRPARSARARSARG
ncbi:MAG: endonuclease III [Acidobacteriota bacterium]